MTNKSDGFSVIDSDMAVEGVIVCNGQLVVRGSIKGSIQAGGLVVGDKGAVTADVKTKSMVIGGDFEGNVTAEEEVTILATGNCSGKVECKNLVIEAGGIINAEVNCTLVKELMPEGSPSVPLEKKQNLLKDKAQAYLSSFFHLNTAKSGK